MVESLLHGLLLQTLTLSLAALAVRALQALLVRRFGASAGYLCWLLVPVAMVAVALPHPAVGALAAIHVDVAAIAPPWMARTAAPATAGSGLAGAAIAAGWAAGALVLAAVLGMRQWRFQALVASASSGDRPSPRLPAGNGPAVLGLWRRRIVLPQDFDSAFGAEERRLMLLHEGVHLRRADNLWNLLAVALLVAQWFNPIAWWAWRRVRADQETSCDAAVLREESTESLATYAAALLKVQGVALAPPLASSWQPTHPLVERVRMLQVHRIPTARHRAGLRLAALSIAVAAFGGYALQAGASAPPPVPASDAFISNYIKIAVESGPSSSSSMELHVVTASGATMKIDPGAKDATAFKDPFEMTYTARRLDAGHVQIDTTLSAGAPLAVVGSPRLVTRDGDTARVRITAADGHVFALTFLPRLTAASAPALPAVPPTSALAPLPAVPSTSNLPPLPPVPSTDALAPLPPVPALSAAPALPAPPAPPAVPRIQRAA